MKFIIYFAIGVAVAGVAYSLAPDVARYIKIKSM